MNNESIPTKHLPNLRHLEIHVTYRCNMHPPCRHCSNLVQQAPSNEIMPVERIAWLLRESVRLHWPWEWLVLHGGEPTLHPRFEDICRLLADYREDHNVKVKLALCTNGVGDKVLAGIEIARRHGIFIENSHKKPGDQFPRHVPISYSPTDLGEYYHLGCFESSRDGIAFNNQGFYACSPAAAAHRLFGYQPLATTLSQVTVERLAGGFQQHCQHCGYARKLWVLGDSNAEPGTFRRRLWEFTMLLASRPHAPMTKTWKTACMAYKERKK